MSYLKATDDQESFTYFLDLLFITFQDLKKKMSCSKMVIPVKKHGY